MGSALLNKYLTYINLKLLDLALTIEYLIVVKKEEDFCKDEKAFLNFISVDTTIETEKLSSKILIKDNTTNLEVDCKINSGEITEKKERYFNLTMICYDDLKFEDFNKLARKIKKIALKINPENSQINTLQDDVGSMYSVLAYPLIHQVENQMRKLISKFMIINVGMGWFENTIHTDIKKITQSRSRESVVTDFLQTIDFIDLADVLFKAYRSKTFTEIDNYLNNIKELSQADINVLKDSLPKSNWERYFSEVLKIDGKTLKNKWELLYDLRNDVAHNRFFSKSKYQQLSNLIDYIKEPLDKALNNLENIKLTEEDVELITNSVTVEKTSGIIVFKMAKQYNISISTIINFLKEKGFHIENKPTFRLSSEMVEAVIEKFEK